MAVWIKATGGGRKYQYYCHISPSNNSLVSHFHVIEILITELKDFFSYLVFKSETLIVLRKVAEEFFILFFSIYVIKRKFACFYCKVQHEFSSSERPVPLKVPPVTPVSTSPRTTVCLSCCSAICVLMCVCFFLS